MLKHLALALGLLTASTAIAAPVNLGAPAGNVVIIDPVANAGLVNLGAPASNVVIIDPATGDAATLAHLSIRGYGCTTAAANCNAQFASLVAAATAQGLSDIYGDGLHFTLSTSPAMPAGMVFHCGQTGTHLPNTTVWTTTPGAIEIDNSGGAVNVNLNNTNSGFQGCTFINKAVDNITSTATHRQLMDAKKNFEANSPTGIKLSARGTILRDVNILGFSRGFHVEGAPNAVVENVVVHAGLGGCLYMANNHDVEHFKGVECDNTLFKNSANVSETYTISSIISGPGGTCEYVISAASTWATGDDLTPQGINGSCVKYIPSLTVIDTTHAYAPGTTFAPSDVIAGTWEDVTGRRDVIALASINDDIQVGSAVAASACDPGSLTVLARSNNHSALKLVQLSAPLNSGCTSANFTFTNPAYGGGGTLISDARTVNSSGIYAVNSGNGNDGLTFVDCLVLSYRVSYEIADNTSWPKFVGCRDDGGGIVPDPDSVSVYMHGSGTANPNFTNFTFKNHGKTIVYDVANGAPATFTGGTMGDGSDPGGMLDMSSGRLQIANEGSISVGTSFLGSSIDQLNLTSLSNKSQTFRLQTAATTYAVKPVASWFASASEINGTQAAATYQGILDTWSPNSLSAATMGGFSGSITPAISGIVQFCAFGYVTNSTAAAPEGIASFQVSYGTGASPSRNHALTGTQAGPSMIAENDSAVAMTGRQLNQCAVVTGLTVGTPYWTDVAGKAVLNTNSVWNGTVEAIELP